MNIQSSGNFKTHIFTGLNGIYYDKIGTHLMSNNVLRILMGIPL